MLAGSIPIVVPAVAEAASGAIGVNQQGTQVVLAAALATLLLSAPQWLRPLIERVAFLERRAFEDGVQRLLEELSATTRAGPTGSRGSTRTWSRGGGE